MATPCGYCRKPFADVRAARAHAAQCPELKRRLDDLPWFIAAKVHAGGLKLEAEREAAKFREANPPLRLD
jgi:hypothetical protein